MAGEGCSVVLAEFMLCGSAKLTITLALNMYTTVIGMLPTPTAVQPMQKLLAEVDLHTTSGGI